MALIQKVTMPTKLHSIKPPLLSGEEEHAKRLEIKAYFNNSWTLYESLFSNIHQDSAYFIKAEPLRHPLIFYFGHTATFYINKLMLGNYIQQRIDPYLESICAVGVDEMSWDDLDSSHYNWPSVSHVKAYRKKVCAMVNTIIDEMPLQLPIAQDSLAWIILMGVEHERIHLETSSVIMRMLALEYISVKPHWQACTDVANAPSNRLIAQQGAALKLGKAQNHSHYGWDNEYGDKRVDVQDFQASQYLVSNGEYLCFVDSGGYNKPQYWTDEGKKWLASTQAKMPRFWFTEQGKYYQRNLFSICPLPLNWPVEVNYLEAKAFCHWKSAQENQFIRLPTEAEWQLMRNQLEGDFTDWQHSPGNLNLEYAASSCPVDRFQQNGLFDIVGNVWQWTETPIDGYPGFQVHPLYDDFSTPTFDGQHNLFKGGSWISTGNEACQHARYAFRRHFFQHAGFRYIQTSTPELPVDPVAPYEMDDLVARALMLNYGKNLAGFTNALQLAVTKVCKALPKSHQNKVLDLGCGVGRSSFEFARHFKQVDAIDITARYIQHALALKETNRLRFACRAEGDLVDFNDVTLADFNGQHIADKINFSQGDALNLKALYQGYDVIYCGHLLEHLYHAKTFLSTIHSRLNSKGFLAIANSYDWYNTTTEKAHWLGGFKVNGENFTTHSAIKLLLAEHFDLCSVDDFTWCEKEHNRRHILHTSELMLWRLK